MDSLPSLFSAVADKFDDDFSDRLSSRYSVMFIGAFMIVITTGLLVGDPVNCWCPKEFEDSWISFTNAYCWVKNTYYLSFDEEIPNVESGERSRRELLYYQWIPFIMILQAVLFYFPSFVWHTFNIKAGVDCDSILTTAIKYQHQRDAEEDTELLSHICTHMERMMLTENEAPREKTKITNIIKKFACGLCNTHGKYIISLYLFVKILYFINVITQLVLINSLLRTDYTFYGYELVGNALNEKNWVNSESFPRVTMCDFTVRRLGNNHRYTVHCVLPLNMYLEKMYAFLWVWMFFVAIVTFFSFVLWIMRFYFTTDRFRYIRGHLRFRAEYLDDENDKSWDEQKEDVEKFVNEALLPDGVFIIRLIGHNTCNLTVSDIITEMWARWIKEKNKKNDLKPVEYVRTYPNLIDEPDTAAKAKY